MRFMITGGSGFIGSHLAEALVARGDEVDALDDFATGRRDNVAALDGNPAFRLHEGTILDAATLDPLVAASDVVIHLAAAVGVRLIVDQPLRSLQTNIAGTEAVLASVERHRKRVFVASTSEVYGKQPGAMHEAADHVLGPSSIARWSYAAAKIVDEHLALAYARENDIGVVIGRFFNTVGPRQTGAYGMALPRLVAQALLGRDLTVYGTGEQTRCFCDVDDAVRAVVGLIDAGIDEEIFNIGSQEEVTIRELAERIIAATGSSSSIELVPYEKAYPRGFEDMLRRVPDTTKIRDTIGWAPQHRLDAIIERMIAYATSVGPASLLTT